MTKKKASKKPNKTIKLVEQQVVKKADDRYKEIDRLSFLSKNLFNSTLYVARNSFFNKSYKDYFSINKEFTVSNQPDYRALPAKVSKQTQMKVDESFKSFFASLKSNGLKGQPKLPNYLDKIKGRFVVTYPKDALSLVKNANSSYTEIKLSKTNIIVKTNLEFNIIKQIRLVPKKNYYTIEIVYEKEMPKKVNKNTKVAGIDLGIDNLITLTSNMFDPIIVNGKPVKSVNKYANELVSKEQARLAIYNLKTSNLISSIWNKRHFKLTDYFHKASSFVVNHLVSHNISTLVIGHNKGWKQDINISRVNNQKFVYIPYNRLIEMLKYKCELVGINFVIQEESYTSKASFLDRDEIPEYNSSKKFKFSGKRQTRGMYISKEGIKVNADINGSMNIIRKYLTKLNKYTDRVHNALAKRINNITVITM